MFRTILLPLFFSFHLLQAQVVLFPGDTNNDGASNQYDLLPVGVAYGTEGFPRPGASIEWMPQIHPDLWPQNLPVSGINLAFVDTDGNGLIDSLDIDAIAFNFDSVQNASQPPPQPYLPPDTCFSCPQPQLLITFDRDTAFVTDTFYAFLTLQYPPNVPQQAGALGIAFDLDYDPENVKDELTKVFADTMPGDLLFVTATSTLVRPWRAVPPGKIGFGATGKGVNAFFETRPLGAVEIVVEDMIIRSQGVSVPFWLDASNFLLVNRLEQVVLPGGVVVDTVVLFDLVNVTSGPDGWAGRISVFPNPATGEVFIQSPLLSFGEMEITGLAGNLLRREKSEPAHEGRFNVTGFPPGLYFLKIKTGYGAVVKKLQVK